MVLFDQQDLIAEVSWTGIMIADPGGTLAGRVVLSHGPDGITLRTFDLLLPGGPPDHTGRCD